MSTLIDAWDETLKRKQEVELRNLMFPNIDLEEAMKQAEKDLREKGHATILGKVLRKEWKDSLYILQPVLNHYRELRGECLIYI